MKLHLDQETFKEFAVRATDHHGYSSPAKIEKDYWLTLFLKTLIGMQPGIVFKGGTSLSRCYKVIERFSEDIDLNFAVPDGTSALSHKQELAGVVNEVILQLGLHLNNPGSIKDTHEVNQYYVKYPRSFEDKSIKQFVVVETVVHIKSFPVEEKEMGCILYDYLIANNGNDEIERYELQPFKLKAQSLERTFIDKVFALADYTLSGKTTDHSRHIYDLYMIYSKIKLDDSFKALVSEVRSVRRGLRDTFSANDGVNLNAVLASAVDDDIYRYDYGARTFPLLGMPVKYSEAVTVIAEIIKSGCFV